MSTLFLLFLLASVSALRVEFDSSFNEKQQKAFQEAVDELRRLPTGQKLITQLESLQAEEGGFCHEIVLRLRKSKKLGIDGILNLDLPFIDQESEEERNSLLPAQIAVPSWEHRTTSNGEEMIGVGSLEEPFFLLLGHEFIHLLHLCSQGLGRFKERMQLDLASKDLIVRGRRMFPNDEEFYTVSGVDLKALTPQQVPAVVSENDLLIEAGFPPRISYSSDLIDSWMPLKFMIQVYPQLKDVMEAVDSSVVLFDKAKADQESAEYESRKDSKLLHFDFVFNAVPEGKTKRVLRRKPILRSRA